MKVSIITPSYNQGQFLEETILSVLNQDYPDLEYIIIDGGSTDNSVEIIKRYQHRLAYWVSEPDKGQADAITKGFKKATGEILAWLNSDDLYTKRAIPTIVDFFSRHKDIDCVYGDLHEIDTEGKKIHTIKSISYNYKMHLYGESLIPQPTCFFRKKVFDIAGYPDVDMQYQMDFDFFIRLGKNNMRFTNIPRTLASFRFHRDTKTTCQDGREKIRQANQLVKDKYNPRFFARLRVLDKCWLIFLKWVYRIAAFLIRVITRRQFIPFRTKVALRRITR